MNTLEQKFDEIDVRDDKKADTGFDLQTKQKARELFLSFAVKDQGGNIDWRDAKNIALFKEISALLKRQDQECFDIELTIKAAKEKVFTGTQEKLTGLQEEMELSRYAKYFSIPESSLKTLSQTLKEGNLNLNILQLLEKYKSYIDSNLIGLAPKYLAKVKMSIGLRILSIGKEVEKLKSKEADMKDFANNKWIINEKVEGLFQRVDKAILPSCVFYIRYSQKVQADAFVKNYNKKYPAFFKVDEGERANNMELWLSETKKVLESDLDEEGNFKFQWFGFGTQIILDERRPDSESFLQEAQIPKVDDTNLLSEEDRGIEKKAKLYFMAAIAAQISVETVPFLAGPIAGGVGTVAGGSIDFADMFSNTEVLLDILQKAGLVDPKYRMEKTFWDNILAGLGILPGMTLALKSEKVTKVLAKFPSNQVTKAISESTEALKDWAKGRTKLVKELGYSVEDVKKYSSMSVDDMLKIATRAEREKAAEIILGQKLSGKQKDAIWEAHIVGKAPFTFTDIKEKIRILTRDNLFEEKIRKKLLERGVCGEQGDPYKLFPVLEQHRKIIGEISTSDIKGVGQNAITVKSKTDGLLHKIPLREKDVEKIVTEADSQSKFYLALEEGKKAGEIPEFIKIPKVRNHPSEHEGLFSMELVDGKSLSTLDFRITRKDLLHDSDAVLDALSDFQIQQLLRERGMKEDELLMLASLPAKRVLQETFQFRPNLLEGLEKAIEYLKKKGLIHDDLHAGNVLVDKDWNLYIIDFGMVK